MSKTVEKVVINPESIDVISTLDGVNSITQLNLEPEDNEVQKIYEKYNLSSITNYPFDMKIVRALSENEEQLRSYLELCKSANNTNNYEITEYYLPDEGKGSGPFIMAYSEMLYL